MKRKIVSEEYSSHFLNKEYILNVFKIVAFYGFDNMKDICIFSMISKSFYDWTNQNVILRGLFLDFYKFKTEVIDCVFYDFAFPRLSLLKLHDRILLYCIEFDYELNSHAINELSLTGISKNRLILRVRFGKESRHLYETVTEDSYMNPILEFKENRIELYVNNK